MNIPLFTSNRVLKYLNDLLTDKRSELIQDKEKLKDLKSNIKSGNDQFRAVNQEAEIWNKEAYVEDLDRLIRELNTLKMDEEFDRDLKAEMFQLLLRLNEGGTLSNVKDDDY